MKKRSQNPSGVLVSAERFLTTLANVRIECSGYEADPFSIEDAEEILRRFPRYLPPSLVPAPGDAEVKNRNTTDGELIARHFGEAINYEITADDIRREHLQRVWVLASKVRRIWNEEDSRRRDWHIFQTRLFYHSQLNFERRMDPPDPSPFEDAMLYLQRHGDRARRCINPDCPAPYYFSPDLRPRTYCSSKCAGPAKRAAKRKWWANNRRGGNSQ